MSQKPANRLSDVAHERVRGEVVKRANEAPLLRKLRARPLATWDRTATAANRLGPPGDHLGYALRALSAVRLWDRRSHVRTPRGTARGKATELVTQMRNLGGYLLTPLAQRIAASA